MADFEVLGDALVEGPRGSWSSRLASSRVSFACYASPNQQHYGVLLVQFLLTGPKVRVLHRPTKCLAEKLHLVRCVTVCSR